ncbi:MAG: 3,4-dihydroxy-2-butanone-4-phosphate synthase [Candidatus Altiarchaeales archaeon HGW-Altiarchaeales-1]|nr:MAG: 3,4-dihydroxy-2-butanone-4-phosphate synthase [Candidatus Altiarchaeales archaeon HGW-Altiarchaeales-1]
MLNKAIKSLREGNFIIIHDADSRENECDFVIAAEFIKPEHVARMRTEGGGMICLAVSGEIAEMTGMPFFSEIRDFASEKFKVLEKMTDNDLKYDKKSAFSININFRGVFTGISDFDRALTIKKFADFARNLKEEKNQNMNEFAKNFRTPGHVHLLISRGIENRAGHTELATEILKIAGLTPVAAICEILDGEIFKAKSKEKVFEYANRHNIPVVEGREILKNL